MRRIKHLLVLLVVVLLASCNNYEDIRIERVAGVSLREINGSTAIVDLSLVVRNPTGSRVHLNKVDLEVNRKDAKFAHIISLDKVTIPANSTIEKTVALEVRLSNVLSSGFMLLSKRLKPEDFTATGYVKVSSFPFAKKIRFENENVGTILNGIESITDKH